MNKRGATHTARADRETDANGERTHERTKGDAQGERHGWSRHVADIRACALSAGAPVFHMWMVVVTDAEALSINAAAGETDYLRVWTDNSPPHKL